MKHFLVFSVIFAVAFGSSAVNGGEEGWVSMFDGETLNGWKSNEENPNGFSVEKGAIKVVGKRAHLFYVGESGDASFKNFEFKAKVKTLASANSGIYFHTKFQEKGWPDAGYEAQVNATHKDPKKTGSLYAVSNIYVNPEDSKNSVGSTFFDEKTGHNVVRSKAPNQDDQWFEYFIKVVGTTIVVKIDGKEVINYTEPDDGSLPNPKLKGRKLSKGTFALQCHDPGSTAYFKDIFVRVLPD